MQIEERFYSSTEVAEILGVSLRSIYRYLEEGKLDAEIKTATGRHRFTKQNILDFLYPKVQSSTVVATKVETSTQIETQNVVPPVQTEEVSLDITEEQIEEDSQPPKTTTPPVVGADSAHLEQEALSVDAPGLVIPDNVEEAAPSPSSMNDLSEEEKVEEEEEVDWLKKFREAAEKYRAEERSSEPKTAESVKMSEESVLPKEKDTSVVEQSTMKPVEEIEEAEKLSVSVPSVPAKVHYRSGVGGLKDVAQQLDSSARKSSLQYAFTMQAGMSLHKPISPFSLLHAYVKPEDKEFFEKMLKLTPVAKDSAQICLIFSEDSSLYRGKKELHGLFVVSDDQLVKDLRDGGETQLSEELLTFVS